MERTAHAVLSDFFGRMARYAVVVMTQRTHLLTGIFVPLIAISCFAQAAPSTTAQAAAHMRLAEQYLAQRRPDLALPELKQVVAIDPENVDAQANLGVLLFFRGSYADAAPHLRIAVEKKPDTWKIQALLGLAEAHTQQPQASRADLAAAFPHLDVSPFQLQVGQALIDSYTSTQDLDKAAAIVSDLLASRPTDVSLTYLSYRLYSDLAGRSLITLALVGPDSAEMHQAMARELARHDDNAAAIANYRDAIRINPNLPGLHTELGDVLYYSDDPKLKAQAAGEFQAALKLNPLDESAQLYLGMIAEQDGDLKLALDDDTRATQLDPNDTDAFTELAKVLVLMNQRDKAQQALEHAVEVDPSNYVAHYRLAGLYRRQGNDAQVKDQVDAYKKYKDMKDKLEQIFQSMRVASGQHPDTEDAGPKQ
jgi:tetratricopeptide (TPR) repeat protein